MEIGMTQLVDLCKSCFLIGYARRELLAKVIEYSEIGAIEHDSFVLFPNKYFFNLPLLPLLLSFLSD